MCIDEVEIGQLRAAPADGGAMDGCDEDFGEGLEAVRRCDISELWGEKREEEGRRRGVEVRWVARWVIYTSASLPPASTSCSMVSPLPGAAMALPGRPGQSICALLEARDCAHQRSNAYPSQPWPY